MKYMIMLYASQQDYDAMAESAANPSPSTGEDFAAMGAFMEQWNKELVESGEFVDARGLAAPVHTRRVRLRDGAPVVTDGPYPETAEVLAGYTIVECDSFDRATEIAARLTECPAPAHVRARAMADVRLIVEERGDLEA
ncbi:MULTISPECIES: YciI family protein [Nonomuraea]|uniref:YciI family protein n=1 Tax=Nonomuraea mangrovi TaxID=2316207 RepID=A0ABW4SNX4_9ACTN